ncbi:MAG: CPBP family intramembrane metalloprotease [Dehalococcoidia bacterium]|nr:MAG: CPBP family intramembrane metalloprotease [Dehalococcoidia bacterium]
MASYAVLIGYTGIVSLIERVTGADLGLLQQGNGIPDSPANTSLVWLVLGISVAAVAPLGEELFFRAFVFRGLEIRFGFVAAALVSGLVFAAFHGNLGVAIPFFGIGVIFAWAYHASGSLWTTVAAHAIFNTVAFVATLAGVAS